MKALEVPETCLTIDQTRFSKPCPERKVMMSEALVLILTLLTVKQIDLQPTEAVVVFVEGQAGRISTAHKDYDYFLRLAYRSLERQHPVAVSLTAQGQITEMARADSDFPTLLVETDSERMKVIFQGHNGTYYLRKDHPHFKRLSEILRQSIQEKCRVWFVAQLPTLSLMDVIKAK
jgi:hypothetical protein